MGRTLSRPLRVSGRPIINLPQFLNKGALKAYRISRSRKLLVAATRSALHLTRETFSGRSSWTGADTLGGVFRSGENLPGEGDTADIFRRKERMISGRTFAREMIALRQRETKCAGRILALQGQHPGQLELRTHSEFGANLSVTPGGRLPLS